MKKVLHMIGNSHIDPVWFWPKEEGMQEVVATFASALDRLEEYPQVYFTCTSAAYVDFIAQARPELLPRLQKAVREGRMEITGGWWVEPDCHMPCGESLVRQGLYGQRTFMKLLGVKARIGSNVDSFGHDGALPMILRGCGMDRYMFMRPSFTRYPRAFIEPRTPLVRWRSSDGSEVTALSLPAEYTCWFESSLRENIQLTLQGMGDMPEMACFYGVGNHGGGPTKANIESAMRLQAEFPEAELRFSTLGAYFDGADAAKAPLLTGNLEFLNPGCYGVDHRLKQSMRRAEQALLRSERLSALASLRLGESESADTFARLWKRLLFCQFHDTLCGTAIREGRDNAQADMDGVTVEAEAIAQVAVQRLAACEDTRGAGQPILLINDTDEDFDGLADMELSWFCKDPLMLTDGAREIPYQTAQLSCTARWYNLGGRRRVVFPVKVPAMGVKLLRAWAREPSPLSAPEALPGLVLDNGLLRVEADAAGRILSIQEKKTGRQALQEPMVLRVFLDQGDSWGKRQNGWERYEEQLPLRCSEAVRTCDGPLRQTLRLRLEGEGGAVRLLLHLDAGDPFLRVEMHVLWQAPHHRLKLRMPLCCHHTLAETPMGESLRPATGEEGYMHRYLDAVDEAGAGLLCVNDGVYAFDADASGVEMTLLRTSIYGHGNCVGWYDPNDTYDYCDLGEHRYTFLLQPHSEPLTARQRRKLAQRLSSPLIALVNMRHEALEAGTGFSLSGGSVRLEALKPAEDGGLAVRLREVEGTSARCVFSAGGTGMEAAFAPCQCRTFLFRNGSWRESNMLEE